MRTIALVPALIFLSAWLSGWSASQVVAADGPKSRGACLTKAEQQAAIDGRRALPLAEVIKSLRARGQRGDLVRARLCWRGESLAHVLTLLGRSGKVVVLTVDAANGAFINGR